MVEQAERRPRVEVVTRSISTPVVDEFDDNEIIDFHHGKLVEVLVDGRDVWRKTIYPIFVILTSFADVPRPRYTQRIASAKRKGEKIASKYKQKLGII